MEALLVSTGVVALAEIGDKTQLLALVLATRYRRPGAVIAGIALATLLNHAIAAAIGAAAPALLDGAWIRWALGLSFLAMAAWTLVPDRIEDTAVPRRYGGAFLATLVAFFLVEIGDKTQIATAMLAASYAAWAPVVLGSTLGMLVANVPAVLCGEWLARAVPLRLIRALAALAFVGIGMAILTGMT